MTPPQFRSSSGVLGWGCCSLPASVLLATLLIKGFPNHILLSYKNPTGLLVACRRMSSFLAWLSFLPHPLRQASCHAVCLLFSSNPGLLSPGCTFKSPGSFETYPRQTMFPESLISLAWDLEVVGVFRNLPQVILTPSQGPKAWPLLQPI